MAISSIADLIAAFDHAYCTEGPEFQALMAPSGGGLKVGWIDLTPGVTPTAVATWPDEVGTLDLIQATGTARPTYSSSHASWGLPAVVFDGGDHLHSAALGSAYSQPYDIVVIARSSVGGGFYCVAADGKANNVQVGTNSSPNGWLFYQTSVLTSASAPNTSKHLIRARADTTDKLFIDEVSVVSGAAGTTALDGFSLGSHTGFNNWFGEIVFAGIKSGGLSAGTILDVHSFSQSHYSTP